MCAVITDSAQLPAMRLASGDVPTPFGQIKLNCLELLTVSADFAQFKCGLVLKRLPLPFWRKLLTMAITHCASNMFLCHFRRLIHLAMIFRRRFLKHLFVECQMMERLVDFYQNRPLPRCTLHGYIVQMLWDIEHHDQQDDDDEDEEEEDENGDSEDDEAPQQRASVVIKPDLAALAVDDEGDDNG